MRINSIVLILLALMVGLNVLPLSKASAVTAADWKAGNIMDDAVFTNRKAMSVSQIQSWLNKRLVNCDYYGKERSELGGGKDYDGNGVVTRAEWARTKGYPTRFTCLNMYYEVPKTAPSKSVPASNYASSTKPTGSKSAAQLIYDAAQAYNISPKVLLVKLATESAGPLTSDVWPLKGQYTYAMGAHCPDSGPGGSANCDVNYSGFSIQMREAAALMRWYLDSMDESWWSYKKPYQINHILWNVVERGCGGKNVYIANKATAALYTYTPYQPNSAALRNMYTTGDNCSAYGNRNFWRVFNDWFGSSRGRDYSYNFERLVGKSPAVMSSANSLGSYTKTLVVGDKLYTFYYDSTAKNLQYAYWNGSKWSKTILDGTGAATQGSTTNDVGKGIDAIVRDGQIQLIYHDATSSSLKHARLVGDRWLIETLDGTSTAVSGDNAAVGTSPKILSYNGGLQLFYYNQTDGSLRHAWWQDRAWHFETLDGTASSVNSDSSNVGVKIEFLSYNGGLQLFYYNQTDGSLRHAWWQDRAWHFETLDGTASSLGKRTGDIGSSVVSTVYENKLHIFYYDRTNGELKHSWWSNSRWNFEIMDGNSGSIFKNVIDAGREIAVRRLDDSLFIFYFDGFNKSWRGGQWTDDSWQGFNLDGGNASRSGSSAAVGGQLSVTNYNGGSLQIFYRDSLNGLAHAWIK